MMGAMPEIHDASFKLWYDHPRMVEDLLRGFVPANLVGAFDFDTLEQMPAQYVDEGLRQSRGDAAWRVRFRDAGSGGWLYLLVLLEFQSTVECARLTGASAAGESPAGRRRQATTSTPSHGPSSARMGVKR